MSTLILKNYVSTLKAALKINQSLLTSEHFSRNVDKIFPVATVSLAMSTLNLSFIVSTFDFCILKNLC